jgi:hypothetical protein
MSRRPSRETIESLRLTLETIEQSNDTASDAEGAGELKRILLARIADLEMLDALHVQSATAGNTPDEPNAVSAVGLTSAAEVAAVEVAPVDLPNIDLPPIEVVAAEELASGVQDAAQADASQVPPAGQQQLSD